MPKSQNVLELIRPEVNMEQVEDLSASQIACIQGKLCHRRKTQRCSMSVTSISMAFPCTPGEIFTSMQREGILTKGYRVWRIGGQEKKKTP